MITQLQPVNRETLPSYLSRLAATKGVTGSDFVGDLGASMKRFLAQEPDALSALAHWGGLSDDQLHDLVSWTGRPIGDVRTLFRGEVFVSRALRNPVMRGCPECLRSDAESCAADPLTALVYRGDWQLREVSMCMTHQRPLIGLWNVHQLAARNDMTTQFSTILNDVCSGKLDPPRESISPYDLWLDRRLEDGTDPTALAGYPLYAATTFCRLLGGELLRLRERVEDDPARNLRAAQAAGFEVASEGTDAITGAFDRLAAAATGHLEEPPKAFGLLYRAFRYDYATEAAFDGFRSLLRQTILAGWPIAAGEDVLGESLPQRRLHSVLTAGEAFTIDPRRLRPLLIENGVITPTDPRPDSRTVFEADRHETLLRTLSALVTDRTMKAAIGATDAELNSLETEGVLAPRSKLAKSKLRWLVADGEALVAAIASHATHEAGTDNWETIQKAKTNSGVSVAKIIERILTGQIRVHSNAGNVSYHGFKVCRADFHVLDVPARSAKNFDRGR